MEPVKLFCRCEHYSASRLNEIAPEVMTESMQTFQSSDPINYFFVSDRLYDDDVPLAGPATSHSIMEREFLSGLFGWKEISVREMMEILNAL